MVALHTDVWSVITRSINILMAVIQRVGQCSSVGNSRGQGFELDDLLPFPNLGHFDHHTLTVSMPGGVKYPTQGYDPGAATFIMSGWQKFSEKAEITKYAQNLII